MAKRDLRRGRVTKAGFPLSKKTEVKRLLRKVGGGIEITADLEACRPKRAS